MRPKTNLIKLHTKVDTKNLAVKFKYGPKLTKFYTTTWEIAAIWLAERSSILA